MIAAEQFKKYFWSLFSILGVVFFWAGIWDGIGSLPYIENSLISFSVGIIILIVSSQVFKGSGVFGEELQKKTAALHKIRVHSQKEKFKIKYMDKLKNSLITIEARIINRIEKDAFLVLQQEGKESFIPISRVKEILYEGKPWKY